MFLNIPSYLALNIIVFVTSTIDNMWSMSVDTVAFDWLFYEKQL